MVTQLHLALIMAIDAKLLVLDEPTIGLDILYRKEFYSNLLNDYFDEKRTILVTTHQVEEIEKLLTHLMFINNGKIVLNASMEDVAEKYTEVLVPPDKASAAQALKPLYEREVFGKKLFLFEGVDRDATGRSRRDPYAQRRRPVRGEDARSHAMNNTIRAYSALVKREIWEHKSFWIVPVVIGCLRYCCTLYGCGALLVTAHQGMININSHIISPRLDRRCHGRACIYLRQCGVIFNIVMLFMVWFYLMDSLYADRKDRSVLFWKSLPLSDTSTVLSKLFTGMVTAPALMLAAVIVNRDHHWHPVYHRCVFFSGVNLLPLAFQPGTIILAWITLAFALIVQSLWLIPFFGWFLLCSAWAKKLVLAWAVLIPLGAMIVERLFIGTHYLSNAIFGHIAKLFTMVMSGHYTVNGVTIGSGIEIGDKSDVLASHSPLMTIGSLAHVFAQPEMWIGIAIGAIFVFGAIWLRRNRSEI